MTVCRILAEGFKSLGKRTELDLEQLTILAGQNSSGKSSIMQSLLLLKQTFDAAYDPGPLLINGPNVVFSEVDQMFWSALGQPRPSVLALGVGTLVEEEIAAVETVFEQGRDTPTPLRIEKCFWTSNGGRVELRSSMTSTELEEMFAIPDEVLRQFTEIFRQALRDREGVTGETEPSELSFSVERNRAFLAATARVSGIPIPFLASPVQPGLIESHIRRVVHVPALRGNPRRTYPVSAVEQEFPGQFQDYVASIIAHWQRTEKARLDQLGIDLRELGLTWKVQAHQVTDTEVEIRVGRLPTSQRGGGRDLVSIADVGFGLSQSLPVLVALLAASPGQLVYLEQPEIHLHPRAQLALVEPIRRAVQRGVQVVLETHSDLLLLGVQRAIAEGKLNPSKVGLRWFSRDECGMTHITSAGFDEHGALGDVGIDFAEVSLKAIRDYLEAAAGG